MKKSIFNSRDEFVRYISVKQEWLDFFCSNKHRFYKSRVEQGRQIDAPNRKLKDIQRKTLNLLKSIYTFRESVFGARKGVGSIDNAIQHIDLNHVFVTDIRKFFPSISTLKVTEALSKNTLLQEDVCRIIVELATYKGLLPQGSPLSPIVSNIVLLDFDRIVSDHCIKNNMCYTRYFDDITISSNSKIHIQTIVKIMTLIKRLGYRIKYKKTFYKHRKITVTGVEISRQMAKPSKEILKRMNLYPIGSPSWKGYKGYIKGIKRRYLLAKPNRVHRRTQFTP